MGSGCSTSQPTFNPLVVSLAHYEIHRVIGKGGFGKVNAVILKRTKPPKWFALKTLCKAVVIERKCAKMIWNERNLLASIQCPHIVAMHHTFQDETNCYVVMDLLLGGDLKFHLTTKYKNGFAEQHARFYIAGLLLALRYLHSQQILHRDIKPDNVILDNDGYARLTDLGISVKTNDDSLRFKGNSGTPAYMAPEMFIGSTQHGIGADFYALGVMTCELLFGKKLWTGSARARIDANPEFLDGLPPEKEMDYYPVELLETTSRSSPSGSISPVCRAFIRRLLYPSETGRLGFAKGADEVMRHEWFDGFDWQAYEARALEPPFKPTIDENQVNCNTAAADFDDVLEQSSRSNTKRSTITVDQQQGFDGFEFNVELAGAAAAVAITPKHS